MKMRILHLCLGVLLLISCTNTINFSEQFIKETSGKYLYNDDSLIEVYYEDQTLYLIWKSGRIKPVVLGENEFFVPDMYKKLKFVQHPNGDRYISVIPELDEAPVSYDYLKVTEDFKTPSMYLSAKNYEKALEGFLAIKEKDSMSPFINEWDINNIGYKYLRSQEYDDAIGVFELNAALHPNSYNVYDSLAEGYLKKGDSTKAYTNFKIALKYNNRNKRAQKFINTFESRDNNTSSIESK